MEPHQPCPYLQGKIDTAHFAIYQTVNHCECQSSTCEIKVFKDFNKTMQWFSQPEHEGALVLTHCAL